MPSVFISCVTGEFGAYRVELARYLQRAGIRAVFQETFGVSDVDTIQKLDQEIQGCDAIVHFLGEGVGSIGRADAKQKFLTAEDKEGTFTNRMTPFGDFRTLDLSYTQWEVFLAEYRGKTIFAYQAALQLSDGHPKKGPYYAKDWPEFSANPGDPERLNAHWERLRKLSVPNYRTQTFDSLVSFVGNALADLSKVIGRLPKLSFDKALRFGDHSVNQLRYLVHSEALRFLESGFVLAAYFQFTGELPKKVSQYRQDDLELINLIHEQDCPLDFLGFIKACETHSARLGLPERSAEFAQLFASALASYNSFCRSVPHTGTQEIAAVTLEAVLGHSALALQALNLGIPRPRLEVAWRMNPFTSQVVPECYLRFGRHRENAVGTTQPRQQQLTPTSVVQQLLASPKFSNVPFDRVEVFVSSAELNIPCEYCDGCKPDEDEPPLLPHPAVLRLIGRKALPRKIKCPPDPLTRDGIAYQLESEPGEAFFSHSKKCGAFFAVPGGNGTALDIIGRAARGAGLGFWLRDHFPPESASECLSALYDVRFSEVPNFVFQQKLDSSRHSPWRHLAVLYDHPDWPDFEFADDQLDHSDPGAITHFLS